MTPMIDRINNQRVCLAHDWLITMRGGEFVLDRLARLFGPTVLYTLVCNGRPMTEAIDRCTLRTSPLQRWPGGAGRLRRWYLPMMPWAVQQLRVEPCDLLFSTSSAVMKSIRPPAGVPHICYCHSPARYIWDQRSDYAFGSGGSLRTLGLQMFRRPLQRWDRRTADRVTQFIANSQHTAQRIRQCYGRDAVVIYPPVRTEYFTFDENVSRDDFYLVVAALEPYKRTDLAIEAAGRRGVALKVVGAGSQLESLRRDARAANVEMLGRVDDATLRDLYRRAKALIFPQMEDFGIVAVEAQACGCPVIAFGRGGAAETVTEQTGVHFDHQHVASLCDALQAFERQSFDAQMCRRNAERFSESVFDAQIENVVVDVLARSQRC